MTKTSILTPCKNSLFNCRNYKAGVSVKDCWLQQGPAVGAALQGHPRDPEQHPGVGTSPTEGPWPGSGAPWGWGCCKCDNRTSSPEGPGRATAATAPSSRVLWCPHPLSHTQLGFAAFSLHSQLQNFGHPALCCCSSCSVGFGAAKLSCSLPCSVIYLIPASGPWGCAVSSSLIAPAWAVNWLPLCQSETRKLL